MKTIVLNFKCSEDQRYVIEEHLFKNSKLECLPSERIMIYETCKKQYPNHKIVNAHLNLETIEWEISLEGPEIESCQ